MGHQDAVRSPASPDGEAHPRLDRQLRPDGVRHRRHHVVPAHDQRDFEFATKYGIPIVEVIHRDGGFDGKAAYGEEGILVGSGKFNGMPNDEAKRAVTAELEKTGKGKGSVRYKIRDWLISRQRYWGTPIPIVYCDSCGPVPEKEENLPVVLQRMSPSRGARAIPSPPIPDS